MRDTPATDQRVVPQWWDCNEKNKAGEKLTALEEFVLDNEPPGVEETEYFQQQLEALIAEVRSRPQKTSLTLSERLRMVDPMDTWESIVERCNLAAIEIERLHASHQMLTELIQRIADGYRKCGSISFMTQSSMEGVLTGSASARPTKPAAWLIKWEGSPIGLHMSEDAAHEAADPIRGAVVVPLCEPSPVSASEDA